MKKLILFLLLNFCLAQTNFAQTNLWGMTSKGGSENGGVIFKTNTDGSGHQVVHNFPLNPGAYPEGSLIASGSKFYGMTYTGGANNPVVLSLPSDLGL